MTTGRRRLAAATAALLCFWTLPAPGAAALPAGRPASAPASAAAPLPPGIDIDGIRFPHTVDAGGTALRLNGAGIRYRLMFKVYAAGLYLAAPARSTEAVLAAPGPKRIHMVMLRSIDLNSFGRMISDGIVKNATKHEFLQALPAVQRMGEISAQYKHLEPGESITIDWTPGSGGTLSVKGRLEAGPYPDVGFFNAMAKMWLGAEPADERLKEAMLGKAGPATK